MGRSADVKVVVVVLGYNSQKFLTDCLTSLLASSYQNSLVLFVDNHSTDGSAAYVRKHFSSVNVLELPHNLGFAGGNNAGIEVALGKGADYALLLNPDTVIASDAIELMVKQANQHTIVQPLILLHTDRQTDLVNTTGSHVHYLGISYVGDYKAHRTTIKAKSIPSASGAACLIPRQVFATIGRFDERFFMYHEDLDLNWRARMAGFDVRLVPEALIWHKYQFSRNAHKMYLVERNRLLFVAKNYQWRTLILIAPMFLINEVATCLFALKEGWLVAKLRTYLDFVRLIPQTLRARRSIDHTVSDRKLAQYLSSRLDFAEVNLPLAKIYNRILGAYWRLIRGLV